MSTVSYANVVATGSATPTSPSSNDQKPSQLNADVIIDSLNEVATSKKSEEKSLPSPTPSPKAEKVKSSGSGPAQAQSQPQQQQPPVQLAPAPVPQVSAWGGSTLGSRSNSNVAVDSKSWPSPLENLPQNQQQNGPAPNRKNLVAKSSKEKWMPYKASVTLSQPSSNKKHGQKRHTQKNNSNTAQNTHNNVNNVNNNSSAPNTYKQNDAKKRKNKLDKRPQISKDQDSNQAQTGPSSSTPTSSQQTQSESQLPQSEQSQQDSAQIPAQSQPQTETVGEVTANGSDQSNQPISQSQGDASETDAMDIDTESGIGCQNGTEVESDNKPEHSEDKMNGYHYHQNHNQYRQYHNKHHNNYQSHHSHPHSLSHPHSHHSNINNANNNYHQMNQMNPQIPVHQQFYPQTATMYNRQPRSYNNQSRRYNKFNQTQNGGYVRHGSSNHRHHHNNNGNINHNHSNHHHNNNSNYQLHRSFNDTRYQFKQDPLFALIKQVEYYFSIENLVKDIYLRKQMNSEGWLPLNIIASFYRMNILSCGDVSLIRRSIDQLNGSILEMAEFDNDVLKVRVKENWKNWVLAKNQRDSAGLDTSVFVKLIPGQAIHEGKEEDVEVGEAEAATTETETETETKTETKTGSSEVQKESSSTSTNTGTDAPVIVDSSNDTTTTTATTTNNNC